MPVPDTLIPMWLPVDFPHRPYRASSRGGEVVRWRNGYSVGLTIGRSWVQILLEATLRNNLGQVVHTCVSVTKQYNLVSAKRR